MLQLQFLRNSIDIELVNIVYMYLNCFKYFFNISDSAEEIVIIIDTEGCLECGTGIIIVIMYAQNVL